MDITNPTLQLLAYELAVIFAVLSCWLIMRSSKKNKQINESASKIVKRLKRVKEKRIETLSEILVERYSLDADALTQTATEIQEREQQLYKLLVKMFVEQENKSLIAFPGQLEQAIDACLGLIPVGCIPNEQMVDNNAEPLKEQLADMAIKLDVLLARPVQIASDNQLQVTDESVEDSSVSKEIEVEGEGEVSSEIEIEPVEELIEIEIGEDFSIEVLPSEEEDITEIISEEVVVAEDGDEEDMIEITESQEVAADDVDALLAGLDVELPDESEGEGIDLSSEDDEDVSVKKIEAGSVANAIDPATIKSETDIASLLKEETNIDISKSAEPAPSNKMNDYLKGDWDNTQPDVYNKTTEDIKSEPTLPANQEESFSTEEEQLKALMSHSPENRNDADLSEDIQQDDVVATNELSSENELPSDGDLENMLSEIKQLEQDAVSNNNEPDIKDSEDEPQQEQNELRSILSTIPSFSAINEK